MFGNIVARVRAWLSDKEVLISLREQVLYLRRYPIAAHRKFRDWQTLEKPQGPTIRLDTYRQYTQSQARESRTPTPQEWLETELRTAEGQWPSVEPQQLLDALSNIPIKRIKTLTVSYSNTYEAEGAQIETVHLVSAPQLTLKDCYIGQMLVNRDAQATVDLTNCWIGMMGFNPGGYGKLTIRGGAILNVMPSGDGKFVTGDTVISRVWIPRFQIGNLPSADALRKLRTFFAGQGNSLVAGHFHAPELALERPHENWANRAVGYLYEIGCDYGNSSSRPLLWLVLAVLSIVLLNQFLYAADLADPPQAVGWQKSLIYPGFWDRLLSGLLLAGQLILNPLGLFGSKPLLALRDTGFLILFHFFGLIGTLAIAMFFISIRRRFKLE